MLMKRSCGYEKGEIYAVCVETTIYKSCYRGTSQCVYVMLSMLSSDLAGHGLKSEDNYFQYFDLKSVLLLLYTSLMI